MGKVVYVPPTNTFPYRISRRLAKISNPGHKKCLNECEGMPQFTPRGIRKSALNPKAPISERIKEAALPSTRRILLTKRQYRACFSSERLERMDRLIEQANTTPYAKLANMMLDLKALKEIKKRRGWSESDWSKHMIYIGSLASPKKQFQPPAIVRGPRKPLHNFQPRLDELAMLPDFRQYRRLSQETWYRDPVKVSNGAKTYVISERVKKLAAPRVLPHSD